MDSIIGLIGQLEKFKAFIAAAFNGRQADARLHALNVGERVTLKAPADIELRFRTKGAKGKRRYRIARVDADTEEITFERMADTA